MNEKLNINQIDGLIKDFILRKSEYSQWNKSQAINYNIFDVLNIRYRETKTHTPFLANLLRSKSTHGQQLLFYNEFISQLEGELINRSLDLFKVKSLSNYQVIEEKDTLVYGRIDILIKSIGTHNKFAIIIENKINAGDQKNQLQRYYDYCSKTLALKDDEIIIVYLTKSGLNASDESISKDKRNELIEKGVLVNMSYHKHIKKMLEKCLDQIDANNLRVLLEQYISIIKHI
jgi:hypothetical protein